MSNYSKKELQDTLKIVSSTILNCEKILPKFNEGTSQHTLLKNRIKALSLSKTLLIQDTSLNSITNEDLIEAMIPITSIIRKCEKAQGKFPEGNPHFKRFGTMINAMIISKSLISDALNKQN